MGDKKWEGNGKVGDRKDFSFFSCYLVRRVEKGRDGQLIFLVKNKNERIKM